jgi:antitoxin (DNA-binding transcriptional repressor) of toxin-antitoxin stability system
MTVTVDIADAAARLMDLITAAKQGDKVIITKNQQAFIQLVLVATETDEVRPRFGRAAGKVHMAADFEAPLDDFREYLS